MARTFNGSSDYVDCGLSATLVPSSDHMVFSAWINPDASGLNTYNAIVERAKTDVSVVGDYQFHLKSSYHLAIYIHTSGGVLSSDPAAGVVASNAWSHVLWGYDSVNGANLYLNGVSEASIPAFGTLGQTGTNPFRIGNESTGSRGFFFKGKIADVAVWNSTFFSVGEINSLLNGARPSQIRRTTLVGWWPLDGLLSTEPDLSGTGNNGTLTGTSLAVGGPPVRLRTEGMRGH